MNNFSREMNQRKTEIGIRSSKINNKIVEFNFEIVSFPFLDGDVARSPSCGVTAYSFCKSMA